MLYCYWYHQTCSLERKFVFASTFSLTLQVYPHTRNDNSALLKRGYIKKARPPDMNNYNCSFWKVIFWFGKGYHTYKCLFSCHSVPGKKANMFMLTQGNVFKCLEIPTPAIKWNILIHPFKLKSTALFRFTNRAANTELVWAAHGQSTKQNLDTKPRLSTFRWYLTTAHVNGLQISQFLSLPSPFWITHSSSAFLKICTYMALLPTTFGLLP